jgi:hypothetical protein
MPSSICGKLTLAGTLSKTGLGAGWLMGARA